MLRCTAIVVTYNSAASIAACLEALAPEPCEIVVVDNGSQDDSPRWVEQFVAWRELRLLANNSNRGFAAAVNQGAQTATGDVFLVLNPDSIAEPRAVTALLECLASTGAAAAGGALLDADGQPAKGFAFRRLPSLASLIFEATLVNQLWPANPVNRQYRCLNADYFQQQEVEQPAAACLAITRAAFESLGGFDESFYPVWFEDVEFCKRLRDRGGRIVYCPQARFRHSGAHSVGQLPFRQKQLYWYENMLRYARKHFSPAQVLLLRVAIVKGMVLRSAAAILGARNAPLRESLAAYYGVIRQVLLGH